jgi:hypothetical protein
MTNIFRQPCDEGVIRARPTALPGAAGSEPWILAATILGSSMVFIDGTVVNVALPALQKSLDASVLDVQWMVESYALLLAALLLAGGSMGDRYGRRRMFSAGVALFGLASVDNRLSRATRLVVTAVKRFAFSRRKNPACRLWSCGEIFAWWQFDRRPSSLFKRVNAANNDLNRNDSGGQS